MLPFLFALISFSTYLGTTCKLGAALLLIQVVCLDTFYGVVFAPDEIGWAAAGMFGGSVIAFGTIVLFDNWLWPDRGEDILLESLGASVARDRLRLFAAANFYLDRKVRRRRFHRRLPIFPRTWIFSIAPWPRVCPCIAMRFCLQRSRAWRASVSKWIA